MGALYYVDIGFSDRSLGPSAFGLSRIRRIALLRSDLPTVVDASADYDWRSNAAFSRFSSAGSSDPEGRPLTYMNTFGDRATSTARQRFTPVRARACLLTSLTVSDGVDTTFSTPLSISTGNRPVATILAPSDGLMFRAGDVISSAEAQRMLKIACCRPVHYLEYRFLHADHVHPGTPITGR